MYRRVLVPLDGSDISMQALPYARMLARTGGAEISLLEIMDMVPPSERESDEGAGRQEAGAVAADRWRQMREEGEQHAQQRLGRTASSLQKDGFRVSSLVRAGDAAESIVDEAESTEDTIIAMATHGRSGIGRWLLGSVTDKVLHISNRPVLAVRARSDDTATAEKLRHVVLPLDGSEGSEAAIPHATALAQALGVGITVVRAFDLGFEFPLRYAPVYAPHWNLPYEGLAPPEDFREAQRLAHEYVDGMVQTLRSEGLSDAEGHAVLDDPASAILATVGTEGDGLIVMSSHGYRGMTRWRLGSVADKVIRHGEAPVLVVPISQQATAAGEGPERMSA